VALALCGTTRGWAQAQPGDLEALMAGVRETAAPGTPGSLAVYGEQAFPVVAGSVGEQLFEPAVAAARLGAGRMVAFGHDGFLHDPASWQVGDTGVFLRNVFTWLAGGKPGARIGVIGINRLAEFLQSRGLNAAFIPASSMSSYDVLVPNLAIRWTRAEAEALVAYVRNGGGLAGGMTGWGWAQLNPTSRLAEDFSGNWIFAPAGISWGPSYLARTSNGGFATGTRPPALIHAARALDAVTPGAPALSIAERSQCAVTLTIALQSLPAADGLLLPRLRAALAAAGGAVIPRPESPIKVDQVLGRIALVEEFRTIGRLQPTAIAPHPSAAFFPGAVPAGAPRVTRTVVIRAGTPRWQGTGLYAPAGELITVRVPGAVAGQGVTVRIGVHSDRLWGAAEWRRFPEIAFTAPLTSAETRVANAFGGLIYLEVPPGRLGEDFAVEITGGVLAPRFIKGRTTLTEWREVIRQHPAPWGEIEGDSMVVTTQATALRQLDDPLEVAELWDRALDAAADLATLPRRRLSPERFVCDEQISAGYMHAGYPLMAHLDVNRLLVDAPFIRSPFSPTRGQNWGFFHEVGHNHQSPDWTFEGTGEVTVNLFTLYLFEAICGQPVATNPWASLALRQRKMAEFDLSRPSFAAWKSDPFLALVMYVQLQQAFGWESYQKVFAEYRALAAGERPRNDDEKRDQWLIRFSRQVRRNLAPFFAAWGIPVSASAKAAVAELPWWMPDEMSAAILPALPRVESGLDRVALPLGGEAQLRLAPGIGGAGAVQWFKDDQPLAGANREVLAFGRVAGGEAGVYWARVTTAAGPVFSNAVVVAVDRSPPVRLANLSVLAPLETGEALTVGTVVGGRGTEGGKVLVARAAGPSLAAFGVPDPLPDPALTIFAAPAGAALAANDDWGGDARLRTLFSQLGAFSFTAAESKDAAVLVPAVSGAGYTAEVRGRPGERGRTLVELYDATAPGGFTAATPRLINASVLQRLPAGGMLTVGFVVAGPGVKRILIRAAGPTLGLPPFGLERILPDPRLELFMGQSSRATNDQWEVPLGAEAATARQLEEAFREAGAFRYAAGSRDAALVATLGAGAYTVQVAGPAPVSGVTLVEVYELP
jgi:hypothetical protein